MLCPDYAISFCIKTITIWRWPSCYPQYFFIFRNYSENSQCSSLTHFTVCTSLQSIVCTVSVPIPIIYSRQQTHITPIFILLFNILLFLQTFCNNNLIQRAVQLQLAQICSKYTENAIEAMDGWKQSIQQSLISNPRIQIPELQTQCS